MSEINKKELSDTDIRTKFITPALVKAGWDPITQMREEYAITKGRIIARGKTCKYPSFRFGLASAIKDIHMGGART